MMNYVLKHLYLVCGNHGLKNQSKKQPNPTNTNHRKGKLWNSDLGNETTGKKNRGGSKKLSDNTLTQVIRNLKEKHISEN